MRIFCDERLIYHRAVSPNKKICEIFPRSVCGQGGGPQKKKNVFTGKPVHFFFFSWHCGPARPNGAGDGAGWRGVVNGSQCADWAWCGWVVVNGPTPSPAPLNSALRPCCPPISALHPPTGPPIDAKRAIWGRLWAVLTPRPPITALRPSSPVLTPLQRSDWGASVGGPISALTPPSPAPLITAQFLSKIAPTTSLPAGVSVVSLSVLRVRFGARDPHRPMAHAPWPMAHVFMPCSCRDVSSLSSSIFTYLSPSIPLFPPHIRAFDD